MWKQDGMRFGVKHFAIVAFIGYVVWNAAWLLSCHIPPSIWTYCTGLPCPTTGVCRSLLALCRGDFCTAILFSPFAMPYIGLTCLSGFLVLKCHLRRHELVLPPLVVRAWFFTLSVGWVAKFVLGIEYW